jgi:hypothetical protein
MNSAKYIIGLLMLLAAGCWQAAGQRYPERRHIRSGNRNYEKLDYVAAEGEYRTAVSENEASFEAAFNLGDAIYKQERFEDAENAFGRILENESLTGQQRAKTLYNLGNARFAGQKLKEAAESYMRSLIINPDDLEAKYNLAYVQKLLEEQQGGGGDGSEQDQDNSDRNSQSGGQQESDSDKNESENQENNPQDSGNGQDGNQDDNRQQDQQQKPEAGEQRAGAMNREDAEKMLEAMQQQEDKTRDKVEEKQTTAAARNGKNW